jgi:hypothetical protein
MECLKQIKNVRGTIFIVKRLENGTYQKLGVLDETLQGKFEGLSNLRKTLTEEYSKMSEKDRNKPAISQQSVKVAKIIPGYFLWIKQRDLLVK